MSQEKDQPKRLALTTHNVDLGDSGPFAFSDATPLALVRCDDADAAPVDAPNHPDTKNSEKDSGGDSRGASEGTSGGGVYDAHMHTPLCKHARGEIEQYADVALRRGLAGITVTCHNPLPDRYAQPMRMDEDQLDQYVESVNRARRVFEGRLDIRLGLEADYVPGYKTFVEQQLASHEFDFVIGSVHPQVPEYQKRFYSGDLFAFQQLYFKHLADSAETGLFDSLAHPDLIKNLMPSQWSVSRILGDVCHSLDRIARTGVAMEFNTSGWRKIIAEPCPGSRILYEMARRRIPITLGSDAHSPKRVAENFERALRLIQAAGYRKVSVFKQRQRTELPISEALRSLVPAESVQATSVS